MAIGDSVHRCEMSLEGKPASRCTNTLLAPLTILFLQIDVYLLINLVLPNRLSTFANTYVLQPILWGVLVAGVLTVRYIGRHKPDFVRAAAWIGLLLGACQVAVLLITALSSGSGFGESPYAHSQRQLFLNTVFFGSAVIGLESSRAYFLSAFSGRHATTMVILTALLYTFLMIPLARLTHPVSPPIQMAGTYLPLLAQNTVASSLALVGGPMASAGYWLVLRAFEWYSPILPNLSWMVGAFAGTLGAVVGLLVVQSLYGARVEPAAPVEVPPEKKSSSLGGWVAVGMASVVIVFATFGMLGFRAMLVGSGSMKPALDAGDIAVVTTVSADAVQEGDIIQFTHGDITVLHRVVGIDESGSRVFITQGDANDTPDVDPVYPDQIRGRVRLCIPKLGWVAIALKSLFS